MTDYDQVHTLWARAHQAGSPVKYVRNQKVFRALAELPSGRVLDMGCGMGEYTLFLAERGHQVTAFDPSTFAIEHLRSVSDGFLNIEASVNSIECFQPAHPFDHIIAIEVFEHIENDLSALKRLHGWLKPGGRVILSVPAGPGLFSDNDRVSGHFRRYSNHRLVSLFNTAGFQDARFEGYGFPVLFLYMVALKFVLGRYLIRSFTGRRPGAGVAAASRLAAFFPWILKMDQYPWPWGSVGYVVRASKQ